MTDAILADGFSEMPLWWNDAAPSVHAVGAAQSIFLSLIP
jgi:hypothetical protein